MTQYYQVLRDYKSAQRPDIMHGYKAGQILVGRNDDGDTVDLYGATQSDEVFGSPPCSASLKDTYGQTLRVTDVVEVTKVNQRDLKVGDKIVFDKDIASNIGYGAKAGEVCDVGEVDADHDQPLWLSGAFNPCGLWFRDRELNQVGIFLLPREEEKDVDAEPEVVHTTEIKVEGEIKEAPKPRTRPIYEVQLQGAVVLRTASRDKARKLKAKLGGKEKGAIIMQYNAVKEIR